MNALCQTVLGLSISCACLTGFAQVADQGIKNEGLYLSIGAAYHSLGGGFDGETVLVAPQDIFAVPEVSGGAGFGVKLGYRVEAAAIELSVMRTNHDINWVGADGDAVYTIWSLNFQYFFLHEKPLQPLLQIGWTPATPLRVEDAAILTTSMEVSDAIYIGGIGNLQVGAGLQVFVNPRFFIQGLGLYQKASSFNLTTNQMKRLNFLTVMLLILTTPIIAQMPNQLEKGRISDANGKQTEFVSLTLMDDHYQVKTKKDMHTLPVTDVLRIEKQTGNEALLWGAGIGASALIGSLLGVKSAENSTGIEADSDSKTAIVAGLTGLGVAIGVLVGSKQKKYETVYNRSDGQTGYWNLKIGSHPYSTGLSLTYTF